MSWALSGITVRSISAALSGMGWGGGGGGGGGGEGGRGLISWTAAGNRA